MNQEALFRLAQEIYKNSETPDEFAEQIINEAGEEYLDEAMDIYNELQHKYAEAL